MLQVDQALVATIEADAQLQQLGVTGVFRGLAPKDAVTPYVVFLKSHGTREYTLGAESNRPLLYTIKAVCGGTEENGDDHIPAADIDARIEQLLVDNRAIDVAPYHVIELRRQADIDYPERDEGVTFQHVGGIYRIRLSL